MTTHNTVKTYVLPANLVRFYPFALEGQWKKAKITAPPGRTLQSEGGRLPSD